MNGFARALGCVALIGSLVAMHDAPAQPTNDTKVPAAANADGLPDKAELAARMKKALAASPVLHITAKSMHLGVAYQSEAWMTPKKVRCEVRRDAKLVFARYFGGGRSQEYVPRFDFKNGGVARHVLVEYDAKDSDEWPMLIEKDLACGPGMVIGATWLKETHPNVPDMMEMNMQDSVLTEKTLDGRACYWLHSERRPANMTMTWDLYLDQATSEPVRDARQLVQDGKVIADDVDDYKFEHLATDDGIEWRLDAEKLKATRDADAKPK